MFVRNSSLHKSREYIYHVSVFTFDSGKSAVKTWGKKDFREKFNEESKTLTSSMMV